MNHERIPRILKSENQSKESGVGTAIRETVRIEAVNEIINLFEKRFENVEPRIETSTLENILQSFFEQQVENTKMFESHEHGASFMYSLVDSASIARKLFEEYRGMPPIQGESQEYKQTKTKKEFIFQSFYSPDNPGALFTFFEQALHHVIQELPQALSALEEGKEPVQHEVYFLGTPTRDVGHVTPEFVERLKNNHAFEEYGSLYTEIISSLIDSGSGTKTELFLRGISMGAPQAIETAKSLLAEGKATQSHEVSKEKNIPFLRLRIDTDPSQNAATPLRRRWQIPAAFVVHGIYELTTSSYIRATSNPFSSFMRELQPILEEKGLHMDMSPEQEKLKKEAIGSVLKNLYAGVLIPEDLKVTEVVGMSDLTMSTKKDKNVAKKHRKEHKGSLGENLSPRKSENRRTFWVDMGHNIPNFVPNELGRLRAAALALEKLKKDSKEH